MRISMFVVGLMLTFSPLSAHCRMSVSETGRVVHDGREVSMITLSNGNGMTVRISNYAATVTDIMAPDRNGHTDHVVLGFDSIESYFGRHPKFGATVGRYANRIRNARFELDGQTWHLDNNSKGHCIHGGTKGFNKQIFNIDTFYAEHDTAVVSMSYLSPHLEGGFPGNLKLRVTYKLVEDNSLIIDYVAVTDRPTVVNFTNHTYFNLSGCRLPVLNHDYMIVSDSITHVDPEGIPDGVLMPVQGTVYDFTVSHGAGAGVQEMGRGYDVNYKLAKEPDSLMLAAVVSDSVSGRVLRAYTTEPGMQFYIPHSNLDYVIGHDRAHYGKYFGFCLEMQHFPDSPNHPHFPSTALRLGEVYRQTTVYVFDTF